MLSRRPRPAHVKSAENCAAQAHKRCSLTPAQHATPPRAHAVPSVVRMAGHDCRPTRRRIHPPAEAGGQILAHILQILSRILHILARISHVFARIFAWCVRDVSGCASVSLPSRRSVSVCTLRTCQVVYQSQSVSCMRIQTDEGRTVFAVRQRR